MPPRIPGVASVLATAASTSFARRVPSVLADGSGASWTSPLGCVGAGASVLPQAATVSSSPAMRPRASHSQPGTRRVLRDTVDMAMLLGRVNLPGTGGNEVSRSLRRNGGREVLL